MAAFMSVPPSLPPSPHIYSPEILLWVPCRPLHHTTLVKVARASQQFADIVNTGVHACLLRTVAVEGHKHSLSNDTFKFHVHNQ